MGNFYAHLMPGMFFLVFSIWWAIKHSYRVVVKNSLSRTGRKHELSSNGKWSNEPGTLRGRPAEFWEGVVLIVMWIIGVLAELPPTVPFNFPYRHFEMFDPNDPNHPFVYGNKWQHMTMYSFFGFFGASMVLSNTCVPNLRGYEQFLCALGFFVEGLLFYFHVHGRSMLDISVHYMLVITIVGNTVVKAAECAKSDSTLLPFMTAGISMIQGTWFAQAGFILYPPIGAKWDEDDHANVMFTTMAYCWHIAAALFIIPGIYGIVSVYLRYKGIHRIPYSHIDDVSDEESAITLVDQTTFDDQ